MNVEDTLKVLAIIKVAYPNSFKNHTQADVNALTTLWERQFKEYEYEEVMQALDSYISTDLTGFMPSIGKLKDMILKLRNPNVLTEQEAWGLVKKALSRSGYYAQEEFDKLPPDIQRLVGSARQLHDWSQVDSDEVNTVIASNFMRSYRVRVSNNKELSALPLSVKQGLKERGLLQLEDVVKRIE